MKFSTSLSPEQQELWKEYSSMQVICFHYELVAILNDQINSKAYKIYQSREGEKFYYLYPIDRLCKDAIIDKYNLYDHELASLEAGKPVLEFKSITDVWSHLEDLDLLSPVFYLSPFFIENVSMKK